LEDVLEADKIYLWDGMDGKVRVAIIGPAPEAQSNQPPRGSQDVATSQFPELPNDLLKVRILEGPRQGHYSYAFRYELTPEGPAGQ
jgi:hypothetical protein